MDLNLELARLLKMKFEPRPSRGRGRNEDEIRASICWRLRPHQWRNLSLNVPKMMAKFKP